MRKLITLAAVLLLAAFAAAEVLEEAAEAVLVEHRAGRDLSELAARADPDPWLLADELLRRGERLAATAFAKAARGKDVEALAKYVDAWRPGEGETETRKAFAEARTALAAKEPARALELLADLTAPEGTVLAVRLSRARALALSLLRRFEEGMKAYGTAAEGAERIGWLAHAAAACGWAAGCANKRSDTPAALRWSERKLKIQRRRGVRLGEAQALSDVGAMRKDLGQPAEARAALEQALTILEGTGAKTRASTVCRGKILLELARIHQFQDELGRAMALGEQALKTFEELGEAKLLSWTLANLGDFALAAGEIGKAQAHLEPALDLMRKREDDRGVSYTLISLAKCLAHRGELERSGKLLREALALGEKWEARWFVAQAHLGLGGIETRSGSRSRALEHREKALALLEALEDTVTMPWLLAELAATHWALGNGPRSRELLATAVASAEEIPIVRTRVRALNRMAGLLSDMGEVERAEALRLRALELAESIGDRLGIADALGGLGAISITRWELTEATARVTRSLEIYRELGLPFGVTEAQNNRGIIHLRRGAYEKARACHHEALGLAVRTGNGLAEVSALLNLANVHWLRGSFSKALSRGQQSFLRARETGNLTLQAEAGQALAITLGRIGRTDRARRLLEETLQIRERLEDRRGAARSRQSLGVLLHDQGEYLAARDLLVTARTAFSEMGDLESAAILGGSLGVVQLRLGELVAARATMEASLRLETARNNGPGILQDRLNLAVLDRLEGHPDVARQSFRVLRDEADRRGDAGLVFQCFNELAKVERDAGRPREAVAAARLAVENLHEIVRGFGEEESSSVRARYAGFHDVFRIGIHAAAALGTAEDLCFFLESGRAGALLESLGGRERIAAAALSPALAEADAEARAAEKGAWRRYSAALDRGDDDADTLREEFEQACERRILVAERVRREAKQVAAVVYPEADSLATIRARLREGEALVLYAALPAEVLALVIECNGARIVRLGEAARIQTTAERLFRVGRLGARGVVPVRPTPTPEEQEAAAALALRTLVIEPLDLDAATSRVLVSPDGILAYVPFALLLGDREIVHVPSGTTYGLLITERAKRGSEILALGDPVYPEAAAGGNRSATRFGFRLTALPATRVEAKAVGDVVLLGADASETRFAAAVGTRPRWRAVHLACHGQVHPRSPMLSALALTPDGKNDGLLFCRDVFQMRIPADLVVLSACETARGKVYEAEGILGLPRAFLCAGAPRVLCSLWKVDDEATRALMVRFYELWKKKGIPAARALREAQAHVKAQKRWSDPYFWAAWTLWGLGD